MAKQKGKTKNKAEVKQEAPKKESGGIALFNPLDALADVLDGSIFDVPKTAVKKAQDATDEAAEDAEEEVTDNENARRSEGAIVNINLGNLFKRVKPKQSEPANSGIAKSEEERKTAGEQE